MSKTSFYETKFKDIHNAEKLLLFLGAVASFSGMGLAAISVIKNGEVLLPALVMIVGLLSMMWGSVHAHLSRIESLINK